jgi:hypothetical protein
MPLGSCGGASGASWTKPLVSGAVLDVVRVVAFGAGEPALLARAGEFADALAVNAVTPVAQLVAVALAAQQLRLVEADRIAEVVDQHVALGRVVAVEAPDAAATVLQILGVGHHRPPWSGSAPASCSSAMSADLNLGPTPLWQAVPHSGIRASFSERGLTTACPSGILSSPGILPIGTVPS